MKELATYKNGNTWTQIFEDGTKIHVTEDDDFKYILMQNRVMYKFPNVVIMGANFVMQVVLPLANMVI